jgi:hypothetical protein
MFITIHAATGALIGTELANPVLAFAVSFILHFLIDIIPHGDRELGKKFFGLINKKISEEEKIKSLAAYGIIDYIVLIFFLLFMFKNFSFAKVDGVIWGIIGGILPDLLVALFVLTKTKYLKWFFDFHKWNHHLVIGKLSNDISLKNGMLMQLVIFAILLLMLLKINLFGPYSQMLGL